MLQLAPTLAYELLPTTDEQLLQFDNMLSED